MRYEISVDCTALCDLPAHQTSQVIASIGYMAPERMDSHGDARSDVYSSRLDGGMPQAYDSTNQYGDPFIEKCIRSYQEKGFKTVWPTLGAVKTDAKRMEEQLGQLPPCVDALTWWTWTSIGRSDNRKLVTAGAGDPCPQHVA